MRGELNTAKLDRFSDMLEPFGFTRVGHRFQHTATGVFVDLTASADEPEHVMTNIIRQIQQPQRTELEALGDALNLKELDRCLDVVRRVLNQDVTQHIGGAPMIFDEKDLQFTQGPWNVYDVEGFPNVEANGADVIGNEGFFLGDGSDWANATLVSAAPNMLFALVSLLRSAESASDPDKMLVSKAAIEEALLAYQKAVEVVDLSTEG